VGARARPCRYDTDLPLRAVLTIPVRAVTDLWTIALGAIVVSTATACGEEPGVAGPEPKSVSGVSVQVETLGPEGSFTTPREAFVRLLATVVPADVPVTVDWTVIDDPADKVPTPAPTEDLQGSRAWFLIARPNPSRWAAVPHPGRLDEKSLALRIWARAAGPSDTVASEVQTIRQDEIDTVRQEYSDLARKRFPGRAVWGRPSTRHFKPADLNPTGDYTIYWADEKMLVGLEALQGIIAARFQAAGLAFDRLVLTSVFRNPVHHSLHAGLRTTESPHQYGLAADIRIWGYGVTREEFFAELREAAKTAEVAACFEPEDLIRRGSADGQTLTHAHVDWRKPCPTGW
jgi:hypothetical protein